MRILNEIKSIGKNKFNKNLFTYSLIYLFTLVVLLGMPTANAESLFTLGASQNYQGTPRSLFGGVQARQIQDMAHSRTSLLCVHGK